MTPLYCSSFVVELVSIVNYVHSLFFQSILGDLVSAARYLEPTLVKFEINWQKCTCIGVQCLTTVCFVSGGHVYNLCNPSSWNSTWGNTVQHSLKWSGLSLRFWFFGYKQLVCRNWTAKKSYWFYFPFVSYERICRGDLLIVTRENTLLSPLVTAVMGVMNELVIV